MDYHGRCHCGAIKVTLHSSKTPSELGSRTCQCTFCRLHGASWTSDPAGTLTIYTANPLSRYQFGTGTAEFFVCTTCGVAPAVTWESHAGKLFGVVRVQCLGERDDLLANQVKTIYEEETLDDRLSRRSRNWTPARILEEMLPDGEKER